MSATSMSRRSLRPQLNQIRAWVRQGRTDAWIAHQLEVTVQQIQSFKREQELEADGDENGTPFTDEVDLRAEDDAAIAAELEEEERRRREEEAREAEEAAQRAVRAAEEAAQHAAAAAASEVTEPSGDDDEAAEGARPRRRRRGGRSRRRVGNDKALEGTFDHGEEGYGLWLDPAVADDPIYAEHWAGHRPVEVTIEEDQIVIRRASSEDGES
jgi:hypothetical protein